MIRCSSLNASQHCGLSASFDDHTTNVYAMMGTAFHATVAAHYRPREERFREQAAIALSLLSADDADTVRELVVKLITSWTPPEDARFEVPIGLSRHGLAVPYGHEQAITQGTADVVWIEGDTVVVPDFKSGARAEWNVPAPFDNLQLGAYGLGFADLLGKSKMRLGLYLAHEGKWVWDELDLDSPEGTKLWERVRAAALHDPTEAVMGPHCSDCWVRLKCPAHLLPVVSPSERASILSVLSEPCEDVIEPRRLMRLLQACQAMEAVAEAGKDFLKAYVAKNGPFVAHGKQWGPVPQKGKEGTSVKALKAAGLYDQAVELGAVKTGAPTAQHRWVNAKPGVVRVDGRTVPFDDGPATGEDLPSAPVTQLSLADRDEEVAPWLL